MGMFGICGNHDDDGDDEECKVRPFSKEHRTPDDEMEGFGFLHKHSEMCEHEEDE